MKKIRIFIAGPKALEGERNALKALAHDLNTEYEDRSAHIQVKIKSYENFKDNQQEYNKFIVTVYVKKEARNFFPKQLRDTTRISASDLSTLIKRPDILNIFSTAPNSGTCNMYRDYLPKSDSIDFEKLIKDDKVFIFNEASDYQVFKVSKNEGQDKDPNAGKPYVVLGGQYYFSYALKDLQAGQYYSLQVVDDTTRKPITKGIYLYFVAFNAEHDNIHTIIPAPILNFLKKTKIVQQDGWKAKVKGNKLVGRDIIIQLTERPKEFEVE